MKTNEEILQEYKRIMAEFKDVYEQGTAIMERLTFDFDNMGKAEIKECQEKLNKLSTKQGELAEALVEACSDLRASHQGYKFSAEERTMWSFACKLAYVRRY